MKYNESKRQSIVFEPIDSPHRSESLQFLFLNFFFFIRYNFPFHVIDNEITEREQWFLKAVFNVKIPVKLLAMNEPLQINVFRNH